MEPIKALSSIFLLALSWGLFLFHPIAHPKLTGGGFTRVILALVGAFVLLFWALSSWAHPFFIIPLISVLLLSYILQQDHRGPLQWVLYILANIFFGAKTYALYAHKGMDALHFTSSMGLIGIVSFAMILGHWYLVTPKLSERPLVVCMNLFWPIMAVKILFLLINFASLNPYLEEGTSLGGGYIFNWIMLLMRVGWGMLALLILSYFAYRLIRMRSIQSATGVLYVMVFFVLIGELISLYLFQHYGMHL